MRLAVALTALAMPLVAFFSNRGAFGPTNAEISNQYPTLLVAAGYAFAIWGLIFLLDLAHGLVAAGRPTERLRRVAPAVALGFGLTAAWMPIFSMELFWLALAVIWLALGSLAWAALQLSVGPAPRSKQESLGWVAVSLHAGWLSLAAFLNLAQVLVAYQVPGELAWSLGLFVGAAVLLLWLNARMDGNLAYVAAALWGLAGVYVKQSSHDLPGSSVTAWVALGIALVLAAQTGALLYRRLPKTARAPG